LLGQKLTSDADHDGLANIFEAVFGLNPLTAQGVAVPIQSVTAVGGIDYAGISFTRDPAIADLSPVVEWSNDLVHWSPDPLIEVSRVLAGGLETIVVRSNQPVSAVPQFLRVSVDEP